MNQLVSIIIPTFNRPTYLAETIKSVKAQTYSDIEIIVVDDGTPGEENQKVCKALGVEYLKISNSGGPARPRNIGYLHASGSHVAWLDDDDIWHPQKLEKQVAFLESNPQVEWVHCYSGYINAEDTRTRIGQNSLFSVKELQGDIFLSSIRHVLVKNPTPLIRRSLINKAGLYNEMIKGSEDWEYWARLSWYSNLGLVPEILAYYRVDNSGKISQDAANYANIPVVLNDMLSKLPVTTEEQKLKIKAARQEVQLLARKRLGRTAMRAMNNRDRLNTLRVAFGLG